MANAFLWRQLRAAHSPTACDWLCPCEHVFAAAFNDAIAEIAHLPEDEQFLWVSELLQIGWDLDFCPLYKRSSDELRRFIRNECKRTGNGRYRPTARERKDEETMRYDRLEKLARVGCPVPTDPWRCVCGHRQPIQPHDACRRCERLWWDADAWRRSHPEPHQRLG
jgi:hypothetical protein